HALVRRVLDDRARILGIRTGVARRAATLNGERGVHRHRAAGVVREGGDAVVAGGTVVEQVDRRAAEVVRVDHAVPATADLRRGVDVVAARGRGAGAAAAVAPAAGPRRAAVRTAPLHARAWRGFGYRPSVVGIRPWIACRTSALHSQCRVHRVRAGRGGGEGDHAVVAVGVVVEQV